MQLASKSRVIMNSREFNHCRILTDAHREFEEELYRELIEKYKDQLRREYRAKRWWHKFFPFEIIIRRRNVQND
jgi:hypothetical protein